MPLTKAEAATLKRLADKAATPDSKPKPAPKKPAPKTTAKKQAAVKPKTAAKKTPKK